MGDRVEGSACIRGLYKGAIKKAREGAMLVLTRKSGEAIRIGDEIRILVVEVRENQVRIGIEAPADVPVHREEVYMRILEENRRAAIPDTKILQEVVEKWRKR